MFLVVLMTERNKVSALRKKCALLMFAHQLKAWGYNPAPIPKV